MTPWQVHSLAPQTSRDTLHDTFVFIAQHKQTLHILIDVLNELILFLSLSSLFLLLSWLQDCNRCAVANVRQGSHWVLLTGSFRCVCYLSFTCSERNRQEKIGKEKSFFAVFSPFFRFFSLRTTIGYKGNGVFYVHDPAGFQSEYTYDEIYEHRASLFTR